MHGRGRVGCVEVAVRGRVRGVVVVALVTLTAMAGCATGVPGSTPTTGAAARPAPTPTEEPGARCPEEAAQGRAVRATTPAGSSIGAVSLRNGTTAVIMAHQSGGNLCQWMPYATILASKGYRVLAFDFVGYGSSTMVGPQTFTDDIAALVALVRAEGATKVVLVGASMGGTMSLVAATTIQPAVQAVISVSAPTSFDGVNALAAVPALTMPALFMAAEGDGAFGSAARELAGATPKGKATLDLIDTFYHGVSLLDPTWPDSEPFRKRIEDFIAAA